MKKIKRVLAVLSAATVMSATGMSFVCAEETYEYYANSENSEYSSDFYTVYKNGDIHAEKKFIDSFLFFVPEDVEVTNEYLELSDDYIISSKEPLGAVSLLKNFTEKNNLEYEKAYWISCSGKGDEEIVQTLKELMINNKIDAAFRWNYYTFTQGVINGINVKLKSDIDFNPNDIEGLENLSFKKVSDTEYYISMDNKTDYSSAEEIVEKIKSNENVESADIYVLSDLLGRVLYSTEPIYVRIDGDSNSDNRLTANDAAYIAKKLAERQKEMLPTYSDFNGDGNVTALDAAEVAKYLAEKSIG